MPWALLTSVTHWSTEDASLSSRYLSYSVLSSSELTDSGCPGVGLILSSSWMILPVALEALQARCCCSLCSSLLSVAVGCRSQLCAGVRVSVRSGSRTQAVGRAQAPLAESLFLI